MGITVAEAVYIMWVRPWTYGWCRNREPRALISIPQTITRKGFFFFFLLSASAPVCTLCSIINVHNVAKFMRWVFLQREQYARAHEKKKKKSLSGETSALRELWVMSWKTALIMLTVTRQTDANVSGSINNVWGVVSVLWMLSVLTLSLLSVSLTLFNYVNL